MYEKSDNFVAFVAKIEKRYRIFIPKRVREVLELEEGDYVQVKIRRVKQAEKIVRTS